MDLYKALRNYFWTYDFVKVLVDLEDAVLVRFPNMSNVRSLLNKLSAMAKSCSSEDEELEKAFKSMKKLVEENDCNFAYLVVNVKE